MATLLIIDVQNTYINYINKTNIINSIQELSKNYHYIYYLWDNVSGQEYSSEIPEEWSFDEEREDQELSSKFSKIIEKQYGFFRDFMDSQILNEEDLVELIKFMIKHNIVDGREIAENIDLFDKFNIQFEKSDIKNINFDDYFISIPTDLIEELKDSNSYVLVGGGINECLREIAILLKSLDIDYQISYEHCY